MIMMKPKGQRVLGDKRCENAENNDQNAVLIDLEVCWCCETANPMRHQRGRRAAAWGGRRLCLAVAATAINIATIAVATIAVAIAVAIVATSLARGVAITQLVCEGSARVAALPAIFAATLRCHTSHVTRHTSHITHTCKSHRTNPQS